MVLSNTIFILSSLVFGFSCSIYSLSDDRSHVSFLLTLKVIIPVMCLEINNIA